MRVIAGTAKGRPLVAPRGHRVRPTADKVKGAIFSMLDAEAKRRTDEPIFPFPRVLDLYAGTGALGIEALSRGAAHVDFLETDREARACIQENLRRTGFTEQATIYPVSAERALSIFREPYDLILLDPPYGDPSALEVLGALGRSRLVGEGGVAVLEHARAMPSPPEAGALQLDRVRYYGSTAVSLYLPRDGGTGGCLEAERSRRL